MKVLMSALIALSVAASLSAPASATFTPSSKTKQILDKMDREGLY